MKDKLAISVVTFNRYKHIIEDLQLIVFKAKQLDIGIYIFDGSNEKSIELEDVINQYKIRGFDKIFYYHYGDKSYEGFNENVERRLYDAFQIPEAEYVLLSGDKSFLEPEEYNRIINLLDKNPDIISLYDQGYKEYSSVKDFVKENIIGLTYFGSTIIKKDIMNLERMLSNHSRPDGFLVQSEYIRAIEEEENFFGLRTNVTFHVSKFSTDSLSISNMWKYWLLGWYDWIENFFPKGLEEIKKDIISQPDTQCGFFDEFQLIRQRASNQFNFISCIKYQKIIRSVINIGWIRIFKVAIMSSERAKRIVDSKNLNDNYYNDSFRLRIINNWKRLQNFGVSIEDYFTARDIKHIAIYGQNDIGLELARELENTNVEVDYFIDRCSAGVFCGIKSFKPDEKFPQVDLIIIAAVFYRDEIISEMNKKNITRLVSFEDVINMLIPKI